MRIGVTLSGGFAKAAAHIGFLKALEYKGISPPFISGSSAGALIGFLYSFGLSIGEIEKLAGEISWRKLVKPSLKGGLFSLEGLHSLLLDITGNPDMGELKIPFAAVVVNLRTLKVEVKREGSSADIVTASCSVPPLFSPWKVGRDYYIDGGLRNCLPAEVTKSMGAEINICSNVNLPPEKFNPNSILDVAYRSTLSSVIENQEGRFKYCDLIVNHRVEGSPFDLSKAKELIEMGFENTLRQLEGIERWL